MSVKTVLKNFINNVLTLYLYLQTSYEVNRDDVVDEMIKKMKDSLVTNETCSGSEEDRIDALRAFTFLLHQIPIEELRAQVMAIIIHATCYNFCLDNCTVYLL